LEEAVLGAMMIDKGVDVIDILSPEAFIKRGKTYF
jgi:replicative DNA helicase